VPFGDGPAARRTHWILKSLCLLPPITVGPDHGAFETSERRKPIFLLREAARARSSSQHWRKRLARQTDQAHEDEGAQPKTDDEAALRDAHLLGGRSDVIHSHTCPVGPSAANLMKINQVDGNGWEREVETTVEKSRR